MTQKNDFLLCTPNYFIFFFMFANMKNDDKMISSFESNLAQSIPGHSVDCVIISYANNELQVLLSKLKFANIWSLPGGTIHKNEDMDKAAERVLKERTGINYPFLNQFYTFGNYNRRNVDYFMNKIDFLQFNSMPIINWLTQRFITTGYLGLVDFNACSIEPDILSSKCEWIPLKKIPSLLFDHNAIIDKAIERLNIQINYLPIGANLLPQTFTMKELQHLYESILQIKLDRANFQRKILKLAILERLDKQLTGGAHKAPFLYKFNKEKYQKLTAKGIGFIK